VFTDDAETSIMSSTKAPSSGKKVPDVTHIFAGVREEQAKLRELKSTSQKTGVEYKTEIKKITADTLAGKTPLDDKTSVTLPGLPDEVIFADPDMSAVMPKLASSAENQTQVTEVNLKTQVTEIKIVGNSANGPADTAIEAPKAEATTGKAADTGDFKVKIKRPKLKV
jgi:hypothetical protein